MNIVIELKKRALKILLEQRAKELSYPIQERIKL